MERNISLLPFDIIRKKKKKKKVKINSYAPTRKEEKTSLPLFQ